MLNLAHCEKLKMLPNRLKHLKTLQHLCSRNCNALSSLAPLIGGLTYLQANLGCKHLNELLLSWDRIGESQLPEKAEKILELLQPHTHHLQTLGLGGYTGVHFPQWMASSSLRDLCYVLLVDCKQCLNLPPLGKLPFLKRLEISNMNHVQYLDGGVAGDFMALEFLILDKLPNLIRLSNEEGETMFPRLSKLQISECPNLALPCLPSLKKLKVKGNFSQGLLSSIHNFLSLESMCFCESENLIRFPDGMLQDASLERLSIHGLSKLQIWRCHSLESLSDQLLQQFHSLKELKISVNRKLKLSAGFQYLTCLKELYISRCPEVEGLPESLQHTTTLQNLTLDRLSNLRSLPDWLGNLTLLETLEIFECPKLTHLPNSIPFLCNLKLLRVANCPELQKRCVRETGEDWPLIAHVPRLFRSEVPPYIFSFEMEVFEMSPTFFVNDRGV